MIEAEFGVIPFEDEGRGHKPRNAGGLKKLEKVRKWILL